MLIFYIIGFIFSLPIFSLLLLFDHYKEKTRIDGQELFSGSLITLFLSILWPAILIIFIVIYSVGTLFDKLIPILNNTFNAFYGRK